MENHHQYNTFILVYVLFLSVFVLSIIDIVYLVLHVGVCEMFNTKVHVQKWEVH